MKCFIPYQLRELFPIKYKIKVLQNFYKNQMELYTISMIQWETKRKTIGAN